MSINIVCRLEGAERAKSILADYPNRAHKAIRDSIITASKSTQAEMNRLVKERYAISQSNLRSVNKIIPILPEKSGDEEKGGFITQGPRIPTIKFSVIPSTPQSQIGLRRDHRTNVSVMVVKGVATVAVPNRFVVGVRSGHIGLFHRVAGSASLPIDQSYRPAIAELIRSHHIRPKLEAKMTETFQKELIRQTERQLKLLHQKK